MNTRAFDLSDVNNIENDSDYDDHFSSVQRAINDGMWGLQGSYGREMMAAIENGYCMLGRNPSQDAYGNRIPSRDEVKSGTKGSREYVEARQGNEWTTMMEAV